MLRVAELAARAVGAAAVRSFGSVCRDEGTRWACGPGDTDGSHIVIVVPVADSTVELVITREGVDVITGAFAVRVGGFNRVVGESVGVVARTVAF